MAHYDNYDLLEKTMKLTEAAVSNAGDKAAHIVANPNAVATFIQTVYDKLVEINKTLD